MKPEEYLVCRLDGVGQECELSKDRLLKAVLKVIRGENKEKMKHVLNDKLVIITRNLNELCSGNVLVSQVLELREEDPMYLGFGRIPKKHSDRVKKEIRKMLFARIIKPRIIPWCFLAATDREKMGRIGSAQMRERLSKTEAE